MKNAASVNPGGVFFTRCEGRSVLVLALALIVFGNRLAGLGLARNFIPVVEPPRLAAIALRVQQVGQLVGVFLFLRENPLEHAASGRILLAEETSHFAVALDGNAFGD